MFNSTCIELYWDSNRIAFELCRNIEQEYNANYIDICTSKLYGIDFEKITKETCEENFMSTDILDLECSNVQLTDSQHEFMIACKSLDNGTGHRDLQSATPAQAAAIINMAARPLNYHDDILPYHLGIGLYRLVDYILEQQIHGSELYKTGLAREYITSGYDKIPIRFTSEW